MGSKSEIRLRQVPGAFPHVDHPAEVLDSIGRAAGEALAARRVDHGSRRTGVRTERWDRLRRWLRRFCLPSTSVRTSSQGSRPSSPSATAATTAWSAWQTRTRPSGVSRSCETPGNTWRSCSPGSHCRARPMGSCSTSYAGFTHMRSARYWFPRTRGQTNRRPGQSGRRWRSGASTTTSGHRRRRLPTRCSTRPSRSSCSSGHESGSSSRRRSTSSASRGRAGPTS